MSLDAMSVHPVLAHFPIALTVTALFFAVGGVISGNEERQDLAVRLAVALLAVTALSGPITAVTGWLAQSPAGEWSTFTKAEPVLDIHRLLGIIFAISAPFLVGFAFLNYGQRHRAGYRIGVFITALFLSVLVLAVGYYGGELVFRHGLAVAPLK